MHAYTSTYADQSSMPRLYAARYDAPQKPADDRPADKQRLSLATGDATVEVYLSWNEATEVVAALTRYLKEIEVMVAEVTAWAELHRQADAEARAQLRAAVLSVPPHDLEP